MIRLFIILLITSIICPAIYSQSIYSARNISMSAQTPLDEHIDSIVRIYSDSLSARMDRVIGHCAVTMQSRRPESTLMRFVADALMAEGLKYAEKEGLDYPAVSLINAGGIRANMSEGDITVGDIYQISPFENTVVLMVLTARQLRDVTYHIASRGGEAISGLSFNMEERQAKRIKVHGENIDNDQKYLLITLDYVATGGDQFKVLTTIPHINTGILFREALISYIEEQTLQGRDIMAPEDVRIRVVNVQY